MNRILVGAGVLIALLLGVGACASGGDGESLSSQAATGVSEPTPSVSSESPGSPPGGTVPSETASSSAAPQPGRSTPGAAACPVGDKQRETEEYLRAIGTFGTVTVDGVQSTADCDVIVKFQKRFGISPASGKAGPTTADVARRIAASGSEQERAKCGAGSGLVVCVDLTSQTMWLARDGALAWGPTIVRTGFRGYATPAGTYKIYYRNQREWSNPYEVWMPYWQAFNGGIGLHETTTYIHDGSLGSHGCVNLLHADAKELWTLLGVGTTVKTFGRRPST